MWQWEDKQMEAFQMLKLQLPNAYKPFILTTDWSHEGIGAVLSQLPEEGVEHPICYASRSCNSVGHQPFLCLSFWQFFHPDH